MRLPAGHGLSPELAIEVLTALGETAEAMPFGLVVSRNGEPPEILWNPGVARLLGYAPEEFRDVPIWSNFDEKTLVEINVKREKRRVGSPVERRFEIGIKKKDGTLLPVEVMTSRVSIGGKPGNVTVLYDLSVHRKATDALAASEARFRTVVESAPDGVVILRGLTIVYLNATAAAMLGFSESRQAVGKAITDLMHPDAAPLAGDRIGELFRTERRFAEPAEYRSRRIDGREITVEISSIPIDFEGLPAVLAFARDITERKAIQEKLVQADRLSAVGTLAAGIAHEINNPLAYVVLGLQYLERELLRLRADPAQIDEAVARLREVRSGAERVGTIVRDLKMFARADEVARGAVDLRTVIEAAIRICDNEIRHRAKLVRDYHDAPPVEGNAARLEQVFLNLLVNAAHALSENDVGGNEIRVSVRTGYDGRVVAEVADNGPGIAPDVLRRVFDPFFTTKPVGVGTGLGLPICRSIVESFSGRIDLESALGAGTTARVVLAAFTRAKPAQKSEPPARAPSKPPEHKSRILVVDDEPLVGSMLQRMLVPRHEVCVAISGQDALTAIGKESFDAIVCDVMMPEMTGMDFYALLLKRDPALSERIVFMTGGAFLPRVAEFLSRVENPKLEKPFDLEALTTALRRVVQNGAAPDTADAAAQTESPER